MTSRSKKRPSKIKKNDPSLKHGFRSGLEYSFAEDLEDKGVKYDYESNVISYVRPESLHRYTPDFFVESKSGKTIIIETKGRFLAIDRRKHLAIKKQHPKLDIRFVFENSKNKLRKGAKSTYGQWCIKYGFRYYDRIVPEDWLKEKGKNKHPKFVKFSGTKIRSKNDNKKNKK